MDSASDRFRRAWEILGEALDLPPEARPGLVRRSCAGDEGLKRLVEALLSEAAETSGILDRPLSESAAELLRDFANGESPAPGVDSVGPYRLVRELGRGGMGIIFLAERTEGGFQQKVALKLIKKGLDSEEIVARFLRERQILARLQHLHIARLFDGGMASDGRPFFAMEYVEGEPLLAYCDHRRLGIEPRLRLFLDACSAVQYAHRNLVVHRDLKPSNIHVTSEGQLKLSIRHRRPAGRGREPGAHRAHARRPQPDDAGVRSAGAAARRAGHDRHRRLLSGSRPLRASGRPAPLPSRGRFSGGAAESRARHEPAPPFAGGGREPPRSRSAPGGRARADSGAAAPPPGCAATST